LLQQPLLGLLVSEAGSGGRGVGVSAALRAPAALQVLLTLCTASPGGAGVGPQGSGVGHAALEITRLVPISLDIA